MFLDSLFKNNKPALQSAKLLDGTYPLFSQFGKNVYASDIVQMAIDCIATEISKLQPQHIRTDNNGIQTIPNSSLNRLFKFAPNPLMTTRDFLEKITWQLYMNYNAFIYPTYEITSDPKTNQSTTSYTGFYPLNPRTVEFLQDESDTLFVKFYFNNGTDFVLPYDEIIHLRKKFSVNDVMGGGMNGQPDNAALLKVLEINEVITEGIAKGIKSSLNIRGILKMS